MASVCMPLRAVSLPGDNYLIVKQAQCKHTAVLASVHISKFFTNTSCASRRRCFWLSNPKKGYAPVALYSNDSDYHYKPLTAEELEGALSGKNSLEQDVGSESMSSGLDYTSPVAQYSNDSDYHYTPLTVEELEGALSGNNSLEQDVGSESMSLGLDYTSPGHPGALESKFSEAETPPLTKLFVGNLPWSYDNQQLEDLVKECGSVYVAEVVLERETGKSRGFGFVYMNKPEDADVAVQKLNGKEVEGRLIKVDYQETAEAKSNRLSRGEANNHMNKIFVANLPWRATDEDLQLLFSEYGTVARARVVYDRDTGRSKGFGFVSFSSADEVNKTLAAAANGLDYDGRLLRVARAGEKSSFKSSSF